MGQVKVCNFISTTEITSYKLNDISSEVANFAEPSVYLDSLLPGEVIIKQNLMVTNTFYRNKTVHYCIHNLLYFL